MQLERTDSCTQWGRGGVGRAARAALTCTHGRVQSRCRAARKLSSVPCGDPEGWHAGWMGGRGRSAKKLHIHWASVEKAQRPQCILRPFCLRLTPPLSITYTYQHGKLTNELRASLAAQLVKNPPALRETWVRSLGWEDPLEKGTATHSSVLAWRIPWTVCLGGHKESDTTEPLSSSNIRLFSEVRTSFGSPGLGPSVPFLFQESIQATP